MIQDLLVPEKIGSYYLFSKRIVGFEITQTHIFATVILCRGEKRVVEKCINIAIEQNNSADKQELVAQAIKSALRAAGKYHEIRTCISSSHVIFKKMQLPFTTHEKIKKVIEFEVEPLLPFSINEAVIDFIITKTMPEQHSSELFVAAVQKQYIAQQLELFSKAEVQPEVISIDLFELYGFYTQIAQHQRIKENVVLIEIDNDSTKIALINQGNLRFVRSLFCGINSMAKEIASEYSVSEQSAIKQLTRQGFEEEDDQAYAQAAKNALSSFAQEIRFTLESFSAQMEIRADEIHMFLLGNGAEIRGMVTQLFEELSIPCMLFNPTDIIKNKNIMLKNMTSIANANTISTSVALPSTITQQFNLRQKEFALSKKDLLFKQLIFATILIFGLLFTLIFHNFWQIRKLKKELNSSSSEARAVLSEWYPEIEEGSIDEMLEEAQEETKKEELLWFSFKRSAHNSLLNLLLELTNLDRDGLGLVIEKISIDQDRGTMQLKAQVKDHEALIRLENELRRSNLFSYVQPQDDPNFNMELRFATSNEGEL